MQGVKYKYSVDALKVCYKINEETYNKLTHIDIIRCEDGNILHTHKPIEFKIYDFKSPNHMGDLTIDFRLKRVKSSRLQFEILVPDENIEDNFVLYGDLKIKSSSDIEFAGQCYITLDNRRLYDPFDVHHEVIEWKESKQKIDLTTIGSISNYTKIVHEPRVPSKTLKTQYNTIYFLEEMTSRLGLELISISNLEIALDSNINFARLIKRTVANDNYIPIVKGIRYQEVNSRDKIKNAHFKNESNRKRLINLSFYISQTALGLKCYNKTIEINDKSHKTYIYKRLGMEKNIHRMEVTAKNEAIKSYCEKNNILLSDFLNTLHTAENLSEPFHVWLNKLIHFKDILKPNRKDISIFDILKIKATK
jgi:hypothetical protein